jgi:chromodomain-helicase-DNA-binding protein 1
MLEFITIQRGVTDKDAKEITDKMALVGRSVNEPTSSEDISRFSNGVVKDVRAV